MKRYLIAALCALAVGQVSAQDLKMRDVFKQIPDSLVPYLSQNNRLDFIDFLDSNMKAEVRNKLGDEQCAAGRYVTVEIRPAC